MYDLLGEGLNSRFILGAIARLAGLQALPGTLFSEHCPVGYMRLITFQLCNGAGFQWLYEYTRCTQGAACVSCWWSTGGPQAVHHVLRKQHLAGSKQEGSDSNGLRRSANIDVLDTQLQPPPQPALAQTADPAGTGATAA